MDVFCSDDQRAVLDRSPDAAPRVLPLPAVVDSSVVVLLHLLLREQWSRPVVLDASGLLDIAPAAALLLDATLEARVRRGAPVQIVGLSPRSRHALRNAPLIRFASPAALPVAAPSRAFSELHVPRGSVTIS